MPIEFRCNQCGKLLRTGDETAARQAQCPECGALSRVPSPGETPRLEPLSARDDGSTDSPAGSSPPSGDAGPGGTPYQSTNAAGHPAWPGQPPRFAAQTVSGPATALMVTAALGIITQALGMVVNAISMAVGPAGRGHELIPVMFSGTINLVFGAFGIVMGGLIFVGAMKMKNLESYSFAMAAAILAMIPCVSPCCLLGVPFGIWAIVVLNDDSVKAAFRS